ncbi:uncharacterized protein MELLADRAFT_112207 [Melampsora larici-populina 98AG31]|uniref:Uncharacterized protein n=1 Tax=Melampsora larici-populina (strain 98AG31 / pathotype 3-4-7) TaxID=747676 RepID=F4S5Q4_MELLP|nr:uncharacterized protein MELLADRAFT_112207 [Melampsora larici-populina 98AG31]EGG00067.1 hypothetical protein MELLADRAFT_112207 [Melampsora larici-populina 98AG31]
MSLQDLASPFNRLFPWVPSTTTFSPKVFSKGQQFEISIQKAIEILENHKFLDRDSIWALAVLRHLQGYLPSGDLEPLNKNMKQGPISADLLGVSATLWEDEKVPQLSKISSAIAEASLRLKFIIWIMSQFNRNESTKSSRFLVEIYDMFLQESCPMQPENFKGFLLLCSSHIRGMDVSDQLGLEEGLAYEALHIYIPGYNNHAKDTVFQFNCGPSFPIPPL